MESASFIEAQEDQSLNLREILKKCVRYWYWFVIGLIIALAGAYVFTLYATPVYQADAVLLIKDDKGTMGGSSSDLQNDILGQLSALEGNSNVQNEMAILSSRTIIERTIRDLGLQTSYFISGKVRDREIYLNTPVIVTPLFLKDSLRTHELQIKVNQDHTYTVRDYAGQVNVKDGSAASLPSGIFLIKSSPYNIADTIYHQVQVVVSSLAATVSEYQRNLFLNQTDKSSSVIQLTLRTTVPRKGEDFLNTLIREYSLAGLADKNQTASNTIGFVDGRLDSVSNELSSVETKLEKFLSDNSVANIDEQSKLFVDQAGQLDQQVMQQKMQADVLQQIADYVSRPEKSHEMVPSTLGIQDPTLVELVQNYNTLQLKRSAQVQAGAGPDNPIVAVMDHQLNKLRVDIKENTANLLQSAQQATAKLQQQNEDFEGKIKEVPRIQRDYIAIKREQDIKQTLYVYLLQKREEAAITEAASVSNNRVIDAAKTNLAPIAPKKKSIYLAAFLLGLAIPGGLLYLMDILNRRVASRQDVEAHTEVPIFAEIGHSKQPGPIVVVSGSRGAIPEQFRNLRTNLSFVLGTASHKVILITSSMGGEGKSFISLNLSMTYALLGKRTVLLGLDLRKPKIGSYVGLEHHPGISNYLSGQISLDELPVELNYGRHNLYFINSGPVPPNPAELLLQPEMDKLMDYLKEKFEYIILDTPPVGLITDAQILGKYANTSLYIVRHGYTLRDQIKLLNNYNKGKRLPSLGVVLNDIKAPDAYRYGYGGYGYGNGYYSESGPKNGKAGKDVYAQLKNDIELP